MNRSKFLDDVLSSSSQEMERLEKLKEAKIAELKEINDEINLHQRILRVVQPATPPKKKAKKLLRSGASSKKRVDAVFDIFKSRPDDEISTDELETATGFSYGSVQAIVNQLREANAINLTRKGGKTGAKRYYKLDMRERESS